jgi:outer membrane receptor for ferrienterochelin and colicins
MPRNRILLLIAFLFFLGGISPEAKAQIDSQVRLNEVLKNANQTKAQMSLDSQERLNDIVITGTLKSVKLSESPVHVDIYQKRFFTQNPSPNLFDALQLASGVRPQVNCNICATGDIHINGMEGPYTMVLIDGMPIVSSLASVYGLMGIPTSIIERIEVVKGPASTLYGSEAMGGLINVILKKTQKDLGQIEVWGNTWGEGNIDASFLTNKSKKWRLLTGINAFWNDSKRDNNQDGFTDVALQKRASLFQQLQIIRPSQKRFDMAWRGFAEDRWGGQTNWSPEFRGGDSIYGESIQTQRLEFMSTYELATITPLQLQVSAVMHRQQSAYGNMIFDAQESRYFSQLLWQPQVKNHDFLVGAAFRYTYYDDNTVATEAISADSNRIPKPQITPLPGLFIQDELKYKNHTLLLGARGDFHTEHGWIQSMRAAWKWNLGTLGQLRVNAGTGFRTVNIFTEEHAALTGARRIVIEEKIRPEESSNFNISWSKTFVLGSAGFIQSDFHAFRTDFSNRIVPDYEKNDNAIYYSNSGEGAWNQGLSWNLFWQSRNGLSIRLGATYIDALVKRDAVSAPERPFLTERFNGTFAVQWTSPKKQWEWNYNGNVVAPMRLPLASEWDPRPGESPWWSVQNFNTRYRINAQLSVFAGIQNIWNWTPAQNIPFLLARAQDPFDKNVQFDQGVAQVGPENPYGLTFDAAYVYAPNQGRRLQIGLSFTF